MSYEVGVKFYPLLFVGLSILCALCAFRGYDSRWGNLLVLLNLSAAFVSGTSSLQYFDLLSKAVVAVILWGSTILLVSFYWRHECIIGI